MEGMNNVVLEWIKRVLDGIKVGVRVLLALELELYFILKIFEIRIENSNSNDFGIKANL